MSSSSFLPKTRYKKPAVICLLSLLCLTVILAAGCIEDGRSPGNITITVFKIDPAGTPQWNYSFIVTAPEGLSAGPVLLTKEGSLILENTVYINTTSRSGTIVTIKKLDAQGQVVWDHEYPSEHSDSPFALTEESRGIITIWSDYCNRFVIDYNGTFISEERWNNQSCHAPSTKYGDADFRALKQKGIDQNVSYSIWTVPEGYVYATVDGSTTNITCHLKKYDPEANLISEYTLEKIFTTPAGLNHQIKLVEQAPDGGLIIVGYNWG